MASLSHPQLGTLQLVMSGYNTSLQQHHHTYAKRYGTFAFPYYLEEGMLSMNVEFDDEDINIKKYTYSGKEFWGQNKASIYFDAIMNSAQPVEIYLDGRGVFHDYKGFLLSYTVQKTQLQAKITTRLNFQLVRSRSTSEITDIGSSYDWNTWVAGISKKQQEWNREDWERVKKSNAYSSKKQQEEMEKRYAEEEKLRERFLNDVIKVWVSDDGGTLIGEDAKPLPGAKGHYAYYYKTDIVDVNTGTGYHKGIKEGSQKAWGLDRDGGLQPGWQDAYIHHLQWLEEEEKRKKEDQEKRNEIEREMWKNSSGGKLW